jgi:hypothetical protein
MPIVPGAACLSGFEAWIHRGRIDSSCSGHWVERGKSAAAAVGDLLDHACAAVIEQKDVAGEQYTSRSNCDVRRGYCPAAASNDHLLQERWITGLLAAHVLTLLSVIIFRRNTTYLGVVFCALGTLHRP